MPETNPGLFTCEHGFVRESCDQCRQAEHHPNAYEVRQERRRECLRNAADRAKQSAEGHKTTADRMASVIPFGQPILVGHYSEGPDRRYRARIHSHMGKWIAETKHAEELQRKSASVGTGGISSDDPAAMSKLQEKLAGLESLQERMKAGNRIVRNKSLTDEQKVEKLAGIGLTHENAWRALKPDFCGRVGFPDYALQNNNDNMRRIRERIEQLKQASQQIDGGAISSGPGFEIREDASDNRILIVFDAKPAENVRAILKSMGWRWSPTRAAWVRMLNNAGRASAQYVAKRLAAVGQKPQQTEGNHEKGIDRSGSGSD